MNRKLLPSGIIVENEKHLAIPTGIKGNEFAVTRLLALKDQPGWIVTEGEIKEWKVAGFIEKNDYLFLYGNYFEGITLFEILDTLPKDAYYRFKQLVNALHTMKNQGINPFEIYSDAILFNDNGSILFLPPILMKNINSTRPTNFKLESFDLLNNPDLKGEKRLCQTLSIIFYRIITGYFPFEGESEEEIHDQMRKMDVLEPNLVVPEIADEVSQWIHINLQTNNIINSSITLNDWFKRVNSWKGEDLFRNLREEEKEKLLKLAKDKKEKASKRFKRRIFWERNWKTVAIVSLVVIITGAVLGSILKNVFSPRRTKGFSPIQVVETFYNSINKLDTVTLDDCVIGDAGKQEKNEVTNLYVISRVSMGYEGKSNIIPATTWDKEGRPKLKPPNTVYGILNLKIKEESGEPQPIYTATYEKWFPLSSDEEKENIDVGKNQSGINYTGYRVVDRLYLKKDRGDWVIYKIERILFEPL